VSVISLIICSIDPAKYAQVTKNYRTSLEGTAHEIIGIHDAQSLAEAYNRATASAHGDVLIFSHDDVEIVSSDLPGVIRRAANALDVIGIAGTSKVEGAYWPAAGFPYLHGWVTFPNREGSGYYVHVYGVDGPITTGLQGLDGMFLVVRREVFERVAFDAATFDDFHSYDVDFSYAAHLSGFRVGVTAEIALIHASTGKFAGNWTIYNKRFAEKYRGRLGTSPPARPWLVARALVASKEQIAREWPLARLIDVTGQMRARAAGEKH